VPTNFVFDFFLHYKSYKYGDGTIYLGYVWRLSYTRSRCHWELPTGINQEDNIVSYPLS